jgi:hypothetical protein
MIVEYVHIAQAEMFCFSNLNDGNSAEEFPQKILVGGKRERGNRSEKTVIFTVFSVCSMQLQINAMPH